jgi:hypothetical protein
MPRSPSRDRSDRYADHRGYFRRVTPFTRGKVQLSVLALLTAVTWGAADLVWPQPMRGSHTHGVIAGPHTPWANDCEACHRPLHSASNTSLFAASARWQDFSCERCHAGPAHHAPNPDSANAGADAAFHNNCGNCHHDHNGRSASLVRLADSHCTGCHAKLNHHPAAKLAYPGGPPLHATVTDFTKDHPDFRGLEQPAESRALKFSHALHMTPGLVYLPGAKGALTLAEISRLSSHEYTKLYADRANAHGLIELNCASCHRLDAGAGSKSFDALNAALHATGEPARSVLSARAAGAAFLPVNFDAHCRACHSDPITAPPVVIGKDVVIGDPAGIRLPHRRAWSEMRGEAMAGYLKRMLEDRHRLLAPPAVPGGRTDAERATETRAVRAEAERLADKAMAKLSASEGCVKCHDLKNGEIVPHPNRTVWLPSARFDHTSHRATKCLDCHPGTQAAYTPGGKPIEKEQVKKNILGIDSCKACHSPAVGVRHGCTDCHSYHDGGHPLRGRGAAGRAPAVPLGIAEFLRK